ncbi:MAG: tetratricopeptide repeat protein [Nitrospirae bacterium]|nr:tetratricopeptide repeat protein [Nitrospirota bacterium]
MRQIIDLILAFLLICLLGIPQSAFCAPNSAADPLHPKKSDVSSGSPALHPKKSDDSLGSPALKSADIFYRSRNYGKAEESYRDVFINNKKGPIAERALFGMVRADYKLKRYSEARLNLQRFLLAYPQSQYVNEAFLLFGYALMYEQKIDQAQRYFERVGGALRLNAEIGKAEIALRRDNIAAAESFISSMDKKELERNPRALYIKAAIFSKKGMNNEAVTTIRKVLDATLKEEDLRAEKALIYFNAMRFDDAEKLCKSIISDPVSKIEKQKAEKILARVYEARGKVDEALKLYLDIVPYDTDDSVKMSVARIYDRKGDSGNALRYLSLLKDKGIRSAEIEKRLRQLVDTKNPKATEYLVKFSASISPDSPFIINAAQYLVENGKKMEGNLLLKKAQKGVERADAAMVTAEMLYKDGKYVEAEKFAEPLLLENRFFVRATFLLAEMSSKKGDLQGAIAYLEKARKYSKDPRIDSKMADLYMEAGDRPNALKYYKVASAGSDSVAALKAADLLYLSGNVSQALIYYKRALVLKLNDEKSLQWVYYQYGKITNNKEYLKKAAHGGGVVGDAAKILSER